jgi:hypothetical protein
VKVGDDGLDYCQVGGECLLQRRLLPRPPHQAGRRGQDQGALKVSVYLGKHYAMLL